MVDLYIPNALRRVVEQVSDGEQTLHFTNKGQPSLFNVFSQEFVKSKVGHDVADYIFHSNASELHIGTYLSSVSDGELVSRPWAEPAHHLGFAALESMAAASGPAMMPISGSQLVFIQSMTKNEPYQRGNTYWGMDWDGRAGVRVDGKEPGVKSGVAVTYTGSGPISWRLAGNPNGLCDVNGNLSEYVHDLFFIGDALVIGNGSHQAWGEGMVPLTDLFYVQQSGGGVTTAQVPNSLDTNDMVNAYRVTKNGSTFASSFQATDGGHHAVDRSQLARFNNKHLIASGFQLPDNYQDYNGGWIGAIGQTFRQNEVSAVICSSSYGNINNYRNNTMFDLSATKDRDATGPGIHENAGCRLSLEV